MEIIDFELKILHFSVTISLSLHDFDLVINPFDHCFGEGIGKIIQDAIGMSLKKSVKLHKLPNPRFSAFLLQAMKNLSASSLDSNPQSLRSSSLST